MLEEFCSIKLLTCFVVTAIVKIITRIPYNLGALIRLLFNDLLHDVDEYLLYGRSVLVRI